METQTQPVVIGSRLEVIEDYPKSQLNHFRQIGCKEPLCGAVIERPWAKALAFVVSSQLLQTENNMHRLKAKTDCFQCMLALFKSINYGKETAGAG